MGGGVKMDGGREGCGGVEASLTAGSTAGAWTEVVGIVIAGS